MYINIRLRYNNGDYEKRPIQERNGERVHSRLLYPPRMVRLAIDEPFVK